MKLVKGMKYQFLDINCRNLTTEPKFRYPALFQKPTNDASADK